MTMFSALVRRAAAEAEHRLRAGFDLLAAVVEDRERQTERERLAAWDARIRRLEELAEGQDRDLRALRTELDSLVVQLNDRLLPRIDERMDDTERDLTSLATGLVQYGRDSAAHRSRIETVEARVGDLRGKVARMEQRAGLWRDLQATTARLDEGLDRLRARLNAGAALPAATASPVVSEHVVGEHVVGEHVVAEPVVGKHAVGEHVVSKPVVSKHVVGKRVVGERMADEADARHS